MMKDRDYSRSTGDFAKVEYGYVERLANAGILHYPKRSAGSANAAGVDADTGSQSRKTQAATELWLVSLFLLAFLVFNVLTATSYPFPQLDECLQALPAINYVHGLGFRIRFDEILGMYSFLLVPWMELFGTSLQSIRSADIVSATAALLVLWSAVKRFKIIPSAFWRIFLLILLSTEYGMIVAYRNGRYDGFGALVLTVLLWLMSIERRQTRLSSLFVVCLFVPWVGLQFMPVLFTGGVFLFLIFRWRYWMEIVVSFLASAVGTIAFFIIADANGRLPGLLKFISVQRTGLDVIADWTRHGHLVLYNYIPVDFSFPFLFGAATILFVHLLRRRKITLHSPIWYGILFDVLLSMTMLTVAKLPTYYSYMIDIPIAVAVCCGLALCDPGKMRNVVLTLCVLSAAAGAGLHTAAYLGNYPDRDYSHFEHFVHQVVRPDDIAYVDYTGYLAVRERAQDAYLPYTDWHVIPLMSAEQKDSITILLMAPAEVKSTTQDLGGQWYPTGQAFVPTGRNIFGYRRVGVLTWPPIDLTVYRRR